MSYSTLTRKGQVTIPKALRDQLGLQLGGSVPPKRWPEDFGAIRRQVAAVRGCARGVAAFPRRHSTASISSAFQVSISSTEPVAGPRRY